jgi:hypothetical protein
MPEIKNTFLKSRMNKDLDARILPNGEYRDAQNISISRSEGSDVGSLENVLGNTKLTDLKTEIGYLEDSKAAALYSVAGDIVLSGLEVIGYYIDTPNDTIFLFLTDYIDSSNDRLSNFAPGDTISGTIFEAKGAACYIVEYNVLNKTHNVLVGGNFLNFSKTHPINNVNLIEDLLFWTDNRNQPRKINVKYASNTSYQFNTTPYYFNEDHISVAKFAPYLPASFLNTSNQSTLISKSEEYLAPHIITDTAAGSTATVINLNGTYVTTGSNPDLKIGDKVIIDGYDGFYIVSAVSTTSVTIPAPGLSPIPGAGVKISIQRQNPDYSSTYKGDLALLKDEFAKFSYRFKYDDDEYSLMAPFTQAAFVPKQFGYFTGEDEEETFKNNIVKFMENRVDNVKLNITLPRIASQLDLYYKVKEVQILIKNSDEQAVRVVEDVPVSRIVDAIGTSVNYQYDYLSTKPIKVLPEADLTRVHDRVPVRALTQESVGNRIIYGNFLNKHSSPDYLRYEVSYDKKINDNLTTEFPNHTVKQNRSYQIGVVLMDRYGRASNVILNDPDAVSTANFKNSTIYAPYENAGGNAVNYWGHNLTFKLRQEIPGSLSKDYYPGLYSEDNPLGYYTYKIVVKQQDQDYYNVYTPGALAGEVNWDAAVDSADATASAKADRLPYTSSQDTITSLTLLGDNINKIPRDLNDVNSNDSEYASDVVLFNRVNPIYDTTTTSSYNVQSSPNENGNKVISIKPFRELGKWTTTKGDLFPGGINTTLTTPTPQPWYPYFVSGSTQYNFHDIFYNSGKNPFIATVQTNFRIGSFPDPAYNSKVGIERAWQNLGVFETRPVRSVLDIYWESSTSDLISVLNTLVLTDTPFGVLDTNGNNTSLGGNIQYNHFEDMVSGTDVTLTFSLVNNDGLAIPTIPNVVLNNVIDGGGANRTSEFTIYNTSPGFFRIKTNSTFVFNSNSSINESYTFNLLATDSAATPTYTNVPIAINNCRLQNNVPVWINQPPTVNSINVSSSNFVLSINLGDVQNGSVNISRNTEEIVYSVVDSYRITNPGNGADDFEIVSNTPSFILQAKQSVVVGTTYSLQIEAFDAGGNGLSTRSIAFLVGVNP